MSDSFKSFADSPVGPARSAIAVVPSDTVPLVRLPKALYVGGSGDIVLRAVDNTDDVVLAGIAAGSILPVRAQIVRATGTTATQIVALC